MLSTSQPDGIRAMCNARASDSGAASALTPPVQALAATTGNWHGGWQPDCPAIHGNATLSSLRQDWRLSWRGIAMNVALPWTARPAATLAR